MKKLFLIVSIIIITVMSTYAQESDKAVKPKKSPEERAEQMIKRMTNELALTTDQQMKVKALILEREKERDVQMQKKREEMKEMDAELKVILTPEQYQKREQKKQERRKKPMEHKKDILMKEVPVKESPQK